MKKHVLLLDNYDSFTYNLYDYVLQTGATCDVVRNDALTTADFPALVFDALLLSPGPKRPVDAGCLMGIIEYFHQKKPILGVCLGHQALGEFFGAPLIRAVLPMHGKTSVIRNDGSALFEGLPTEFEVMRYHSLLLASLEGTPLRPTAWSPAGEIMALEHPNLPLWGVQFHPESVLSMHGLALMQNWLEAAAGH